MVNLNLAGADAFNMGDQSDNNEDGRGGGNSESSNKAKYTMPGVLHYLQHEWSRFEMERAQFEMERAESQARVAFLQGEKKGQENLKMDLVRRIKMLELALRQERIKYYRATHAGDDPVEADQIVDETDGAPAAIPSEVDAVSQPSSNVSWRQGRQLLRQYLNEIGYSETILDVRSHRVRSLLGLQPGQNGEGQTANSDSGDSSGHPPRDIAQAALTEAAAGVKALDFLRKHHSTAPGDSDGDDDEPDPQNRNMSAAEEAAINDFDFLSSSEKPATRTSPGSQKSSTDWGMNETAIQRLNEYKEGAKRMMKEKHDSIVKATEDQVDGGGSIDEPYMPPAQRGAMEIESMLEMINADDNDAKSDDIRAAFDDDEDENVNKKWNLRFTLRNHLDSVRCLVFHPVEALLCTASEDGTVKLWNLAASAPENAKQTITDLEPIYSCRAHDGPVLSLVLSGTGDMAFTGGYDGTVRCWMLPSPVAAKGHDKYDPRTLMQTLSGHTDAVCSVAAHSSDNRLISASADGTLKLWQPGESTPLLQTYAPPTPDAVPIGVDFVSAAETDQVLVAYNPGTAMILDLKTGKTIVKFDCSENGQTARITAICAHPTMGRTVVGSVDRRFRYFENENATLISSTIAHMEAISSLALDPNGLYLLTGAHDGSLRLWNLEKEVCLQEVSAHRKKFDESVMSVAFHPSRPMIGSAGSDALAKVYA